MISEKLKGVILNELKLDGWDMEDTMRADQVPGWDSLAHTRIIMAIEKSYSIRFGGMEALRLRNIGDLQQLVDRKTS